jgi:hypothetical protein
MDAAEMHDGDTPARPIITLVSHTPREEVTGQYEAASKISDMETNRTRR